MAEGAPLLREYGLTLIEGSNPFLSASFTCEGIPDESKDKHHHFKTHLPPIGLGDAHQRAAYKKSAMAAQAHESQVDSFAYLSHSLEFFC